MSADATGLELVLRVPDPLLDVVETAAGEFVQVTLPDFGTLTQPGRPDLPQRGVLVGIPADAAPAASLLDADWQTVARSVRPLPAARHEARRRAGGSLASLDGPEAIIEPNPGAYSGQELWPAGAVVLGEPAWLRDQRVVPLFLRPIRWQPADGRLEVARVLRVRLDFGTTAAPSSSTAPLADPFFEEMLQASLLNYASARTWRHPAARQQPASPAWRPASSQPWWKVGVSENGIYALTPDDLVAAGIDLSGVDPRNLQLWDDGRQIALVYQGDAADGAFDGTDRLIWFGQGSTSRYTRENIYWLTVGDTAGLRAVAVDGLPTGAPLVSSYPATEHVEENLVYVYDSPRRDVPDRWQGQRLAAATEPTRTVTVRAQDLAGGPSQLVVHMLGASLQADVTPDHHVRVQFNAQPVGDLWWDGREFVTETLSVPSALLQAGDNTVLLEAPGDSGAVADVSYVSWVELRFSRRFVMPADGLLWQDEATGPRSYEISGLDENSALALDISDPWEPRLLAGVQVVSDGGGWLARFSRDTVEPRRHALVTAGQLRRPQRIERDVAADWSVTTRGADYLAISHSDFITAVQPLLDWRQAQGMRTAIIDVQEIYDAYSDGQMDAQAIRAFLEDAYYNWPRPAPTFVLLVGNGHYDFQNFLGYDEPKQVYLPPLLGCWDPWLCEVASDNRLVTVSGADPLPDMLIGRLPVRSVDQANTTVAKILGYEQALPAGNWQQRAIFVSDNTHNSVGQPDPAGNFETMIEAAIDLLPGEYTPVRVYFDPYPTDDAGEPFRYRTPQDTTAAILAETNQGSAFLNYVGHAGPNVWAHEWLLVSRGRRRDDLPGLVNGALLPVGLSMACLSSNFADPTYPSLDAELLMLDSGGTVASWGATGFGVATGHDRLHLGFYDAIFQQGQTRLGMATTMSKLGLYTSTTSYRDLIDTFELLGDPATALPFGPDLSVEHAAPVGALGPGAPFTYTVQIDNSGQVAYGAGLQLSTQLPPLEDVNVSSSGPSIVPGSAAGRWTLDALPAGSSNRFTFTGRLPTELTTAALPLTVRARLEDAWADRHLADNETPLVQIPASPADLALRWDAPQSLVEPGTAVTVTLSISNTGPAVTGASHFTVSLPATLLAPHVTGDAALPANPPAGAVLNWNTPSMPAGTSREVTISGTLDPSATASEVTFVAQGSPAWLDADPTNNEATLALLLAAPDSYEPDDSRDQATPLEIPAWSPDHTGHRVNDRDWFSFSAQRGVTYHVRVANLSDGADTVLSLYDAEGALLAKNDDYTPGSRWSGVDWTSPADGVVYLMITGWTADPLGYRYDLSITATYWRYLPLSPED